MSDFTKYLKGLIKQETIKPFKRKELAAALNMSEDTFKKGYNGGRFYSRDFVIGICLTLGMDPEETNIAISKYNINYPLLLIDVEDKLLIDVEKSDSRPIIDIGSNDEYIIIKYSNGREEIKKKTRDEIIIGQLGKIHSSVVGLNTILENYGFEPLNFRHKKKIKQNKRIIDNEIIVELEWIKSIDNNERYREESFLDKYNPHGYECYVGRIIRDRNDSSLFLLEYYSRIKTLSMYNVEKLTKTGFKRDFDSIHRSENIDDFPERVKPFLIDIVNTSENRKKRFRSIMNDTRNYRERFTVVLSEDKPFIIGETFNYEEPILEEYYQIKYCNGEFTFGRSRKSLFMKETLSEEEYVSVFRDNTDEKAKYSTLEELMEPYKKYKRSIDKKLAVIKNLKSQIDDFIEKYRNNEIELRSLDAIYGDDKELVCNYYDVADEFEAKYRKGIYGAKKDTAIINRGKYKNIEIKLDDLYLAFNYGYKSIEEICYCKAENNAILRKKI